MNILDANGNITGQIDTGHYENWEAAIVGVMNFPIAGNYNFNMDHDDGAMIAFDPALATYVSGTVINDVFGPNSAEQGYPYMAGNNNSGSTPFDPLVISVATPGNITYEINWTNWEHASRMILTANGQQIVTEPVPGSSQLQIKFPDLSVIAAQPGQLEITGLTDGTAYNFYAYYDMLRGQVIFVADPINAVGSPPVAFPQTNETANQIQNSDGKVPLSVGSIQATAGAGHSGGGGGRER
jgi:hypothetical protein